MKKKIFLMLSVMAFAICLLAISASAVVIDGIDYSFSGNEAKVTNVNQKCLLEEVVIPATVQNGENTYTVTQIADSAFRGNAFVKKVTTPSTLKIIASHAFREMSALEEIILNAGPELEYVNDAEVYGCKALKRADLSGMVGLVDLGNGGTYDHTFTGCSSLTEVILPKSLKVVGSSVFNGCTSLASIDLPDGLTTIRGNAFTSCAFTEIEIPSTVTYIGDYAFQSCKNLVKLNIPVGVTYFGCNNFQYTKVTKVVFPSTVTGAGKDMFNSVSSLDTVVLGCADVTNYKSTFFTSCGPLNFVFYAGEDASVFTAKYSALKNHELVSYQQYLANLRNPEFGGYAGKVLVYGTKNCAYCGDVDTAEYGFLFEDLLSDMYMGASCPSCGARSVNETYAPVFVDLGYSISNINGSCAVLQGFKINYASLDKYNEKFSDAKISEFGVLAVAASRVDGAAFDEEGNVKDGVLSYKMQSRIDYFDIKINNIPENGMVDENTAFTDAKLHLCAYVKAGDKVYYVSEDYVGEVLGNAVSYNDFAK